MNKPPSRRLWFWWLVFSFLVVVGVWLLVNLDDRFPKINKIQPGLYSVSQFIDGDTIMVNMNGSSETVRFIGVDTPETHKPNTPIQCFGREAADYTKQLIGGQKVRLQADVLDTNRDRYGRLLRYVYLANDTLVNEKLIIEGYGFAYTQFPFTKALQFEADEAQAKQASKGLWSACEVKIEANGYKQTSPAAN